MALREHLTDPHQLKREEIIQRIGQAPIGGPTVRPNKALALTDDNRVVDHTDPEAAYVLCGEHSALPKDIADELGIEEYELTDEEKAASEARRYAARGNFGPQGVAQEPISPPDAADHTPQQAMAQPAQVNFGGQQATTTEAPADSAQTSTAEAPAGTAGGKKK